MSNTTKIVLIILVIGVLISLLLYQCQVNRDLKAQLSNINPIHDTTHIPDPYKVDTTKGAVQVTPNHQTYYDTIPYYKKLGVYFDTIKKEITITKDSIHWDTVHASFLVQYPKASKIILGKFKQTSAEFTLLGISGVVEKKFYQVDYSKHNYEFFENQLRAIDTTQQTFWKSFSDESYFITTYNPFYKGTDIRVDYSLMYKGRIGATTFLNLSTYQSPAFSLGIGIKAKIK